MSQVSKVAPVWRRQPGARADGQGVPWYSHMPGRMQLRLNRPLLARSLRVSLLFASHWLQIPAQLRGAFETAGLLCRS